MVPCWLVWLSRLPERGEERYSKMRASDIVIFGSEVKMSGGWMIDIFREAVLYLWTGED